MMQKFYQEFRIRRIRIFLDFFIISERNNHPNPSNQRNHIVSVVH